MIAYTLELDNFQYIMLSSAVTLCVLPFVLVCGARYRDQHLLDKRTSHLEPRIVKKFGGSPSGSADGGGLGYAGGSSSGSSGGGFGSGVGVGGGEVDFPYRIYGDAEVSPHVLSSQSTDGVSYQKNIISRSSVLTQCSCRRFCQPMLC